jgi:outer membrane protein
MNNMRKVLTAVALNIAILSGAYAQSLKIAHINVDQLISVMPETKAMEDEMQRYGEQLQKDMEEMQTEAQTKYQNLIANQNNWTQLRITKEQEELEAMAQRIQQYQVQAQEDFQNKQMELMRPIVEKAQNAVDAVAREKGYTYVLDSSQSKGVVIFVEKGEDILPLVKARLGISTTTTTTSPKE